MTSAQSNYNAKLKTTNMAGANLGLVLLVNPSIKDQQPGIGINNYYGVKV